MAHSVWRGTRALSRTREWRRPRAKSRPRQGDPAELEPTNSSSSRYSPKRVSIRWKKSSMKRGMHGCISGWFHAAQPGEDGTFPRRRQETRMSTSLPTLLGCDHIHAHTPSLQTSSSNCMATSAMTPSHLTRTSLSCPHTRRFSPSSLTVTRRTCDCAPSRPSWSSTQQRWMSRVPPCIFHLVLRDGGMLLFVRYVSAAAPGSRWDVCSEFKVGMVDEEEDP